MSRHRHRPPNSPHQRLPLASVFHHTIHGHTKHHGEQPDLHQDGSPAFPHAAFVRGWKDPWRRTSLSPEHNALAGRLCGACRSDRPHAPGRALRRRRVWHPAPHPATRRGLGLLAPPDHHRVARPGTRLGRRWRRWRRFRDRLDTLSQLSEPGSGYALPPEDLGARLSAIARDHGLWHRRAGTTPTVYRRCTGRCGSYSRDSASRGRCRRWWPRGPRPATPRRDRDLDQARDLAGWDVGRVDVGEELGPTGAHEAGGASVPPLAG